MEPTLELCVSNMLFQFQTHAIESPFLQLCSKAYYSAPRITLKLVFVNCFKMGVTAALIADAFKLAG